MTIDIITVPCLADNYAYVIHNDETGETAVVDVPEAAPIQADLERRGWTLTDILLTHHHDDHIQGVAALRSLGAVRVTGATDDRHRLPPLDHDVRQGTEFTLCGAVVHVLDVPGHTVGHIAYHIPAMGAVFTGDSLMTMGCGRLFEGTAEQMWTTLQKIAQLPPETLVYSGHEYALGNLKFALSVEPDNTALAARSQEIEALRASGHPTVPSSLEQELATNPFLTARSVQEFTARRTAKDAF